MKRTPATADIRRRLTLFAGLLLAVTLIGTGGYVVLEGWGFSDALYMTVITLSTVGFSEVRELSAGGRLFTSGLIVAGVASVAYLFSAVSSYVVSGELTGTIRGRRMQRRIDQTQGHYIICGFGRVGRQVTQDLHEKGKRCVVVEHAVGDEDPELMWITGEAADDDTLRRAGIERAAGLVAVTGDDPTNLFVTLSARSLNPGAAIVARANDAKTEPKLLRAGATHVISPYTISGRRIATQLLYPSLTDFLDVVMHSGELELWLEECMVNSGSELHDKTVAEVDVRQRFGANILAVRRHDEGAIVTNPPSDLRFAPGDVLIALGTRDQLGDLNQAADLNAPQ